MTTDRDGPRTCVSVPAVDVPPREAPAPGDFDCRRLDAHLWAVRRNGYPVGTIEYHGRYVTLDLDAEECGRYRTLQDAEADCRGERLRPSGDARPPSALRRITFVVMCAITVLTLYAVGLIMLTD